MKKSTYMAALLAISLSTFQLSCESKTENKAEDVAEAKQEVVNAQVEGATKEEVMDKQADLDSARKDFKKTWDADRDDMRKELNAEIEDIDEKVAKYERDMNTASASDKTKMTTAVSTLKKERATMTGLLKQLDQVTAANWTTTKKAIETVKDGVDDRVDALDLK
ncbi:hypothetical protein [Fibrella aquatica]|jgi:hypothetical protein|uniref:hypothetical protein n=1 Tax=Fibrella aquatica TaxID=3242487 RepID=UPI0035220299